MKSKALLVTLGAAIALVMGAADVAFVHAQQRQVQMPKEGSFEFDFCIVAQAVVPISSDQFTIFHFIADANLRTEPAGRPSIASRLAAGAPLGS
jgi:hypothetical protein